MDWHYWPSDSKEKVIEAIKKEFPVAEILGEWYGYIVIDLDKNSPYGNNVQRLQKYCDGAYYYGDGSIYDLQRVVFKPLPKDKEIEANRSENRNAAYIKQANDEWMNRWNNEAIYSNG